MFIPRPLDRADPRSPVYFGGSWDAPCTDGQELVATPVGEPCGYTCGVPIADGDRGCWLRVLGTGDWIAYHRECFLRHIGYYDIVAQREAEPR